MSKYYTPTIEEFHVGFEYEIHRGYSEKEDRGGVIETSNKFVNTIMTNETGFGYIQGCIDDKFLRVKHLDREDIESLGFEFKGRALRSFFEMDCQFDLPDTDSFWCKNLKIELDEKHRTVKIEGYIASACEEEVLFTGKCKNKSELKKVLKMIGYEANK